MPLRSKKIEAAQSPASWGFSTISAMTHNPQLSVEAGYRDDTGGQGAVVQVAVSRASLSGVTRRGNRASKKKMR